MQNINLGIISNEREYTLIARMDDNREVSEFVVAYRYDAATDSWAQGHYFKDIKDAVLYVSVPEITDHCVSVINGFADTEPETTLEELSSNEELSLLVRDKILEV